MSSSLNPIRVMEREKIDAEFYFESLLEQARNKGLLGYDDLARLQQECLSLLANKTERYNAGDSSSIRVEKAKSILNSILFTIGVWLKTYPNPDDAVTALQTEPINGLYQRGRRRINTLLMAAKATHRRLLRELIDTKNVFYRSTLQHGISGFFKLYYPDYFAQEIHITADYPLYNPMPPLAGIEFIKAYLEGAYCENLFCSYFAPDDIHHLLCGYAKDYHELLINIYELVFTAAIGCTLAGVDVLRLDSSPAGPEYFSGLFASKSKAELSALLSEAAQILCDRFHFPNKLMRYVGGSLPLIADRIEHGIQMQQLEQIFFAPAFPEHNPKITISFGEKMEDEAYRKLITELGQCRFLEDKMAILKEQIHAIEDLEDVLLDVEWTWPEMQALLATLALPQLAALSKRHPPMSDLEEIELRREEQVLRTYLQRFISGLSLPQQTLLAQVEAAIEEA